MSGEVTAEAVGSLKWILESEKGGVRLRVPLPKGSAGQEGGSSHRNQDGERIWEQS